jgi:outer membrane receptor protein involved in Fe transport
MRFTRIGLTLCCLFVAAAPLVAQEFRGRINGTVTDNTGAVLPGVNVTVTSSSLIQPQVQVTGADGDYRFIALPPGVYEITFELPGFQTMKREGVRVVINQTLSVDIQMPVASLQETVTVSGDSPVVDASTTTIGTNFTKELLTEIPNARDIWAAMSQAPGFTMSGYDVGGSHAGTQTGFVTYGLSEQRTTRIEGINTTEGVSANAGYFDFGSFEEFQLGAAGSGADQDTPGGSMNIIVKSGGDQFSGQWYSDWEGKDLISDNIPSEFTVPGGVKDDFVAPSAGAERGNQIDRQYDINANLGGPVYPGKAWFFASWRLNDQYKFITGRPDLAQSKLTNYSVKGTYQLNSTNQLIGYWNRREKLQPLRDLSTTTPVSAAFYQSSQNYPFKAEWTSVLNDRMFLDVLVGDWRNYFPLRPTSEEGFFPASEFVAGRADLGTGQFLDGGAAGPSNTATDGGVYQDQRRRKPQYLASLSYFKQGWGGAHDFKIGAEGRWEERVFFQDQPFNIFYRDRASVPELVELFNTPTEGDNRTTAQAAYIQDTWKLTNRVTLNLGVRYDYYKDFWVDQTITPEGILALQNATDPTLQDFFAPRDVAGRTVSTSHAISPRAGFSWDLTGSGRTVVKGYFGQFYFNSAPETLAALENPVGTARLQYQFNDVNGNRLLDGEQELGRLLNTFGGAGFVSIDRDLKRPFSQELSGHLEQEIVSGLSARASYVYKNIRDDWAEVDASRIGAYTVPVTATDPGPDGQVGTPDDRSIDLLDRTAAGSERVFTNPDDFESDYNSVEVALNRRFAGNWMALTSFGYTWLDQFHTNSSTTSALEAGSVGKAFRWRPNERLFGRETSTLWNYKLIGRYVFKYDVGVSGSYKLQSGRQFGRTASIRLPVAGAETIPVESVTSNRFPNVHIVDFRLDKSFNLGGRLGKLTAMMDVFNLMNSDVVTNARITSGRYREVIALLDPRIVRFGLRYDF